MKSIGMIAAALVALAMTPAIAWADNPSNLCKPDTNSEEVFNKVMCSWPNDPSVYPQPTISACQSKIRLPNSSADDCGNGEFRACMEDKGFSCAIVTS